MSAGRSLPPGLPTFGTRARMTSPRFTGIASAVPHRIGRTRPWLVHPNHSRERNGRIAGAIRLPSNPFERQAGGFFPSLREYSVHFGLNRRRLAMAKDDVIVLHPGPINRGVEIESDVADGPYSLILDQVNNGVAVRMAVLYLLAGGGE